MRLMVYPAVGALLVAMISPPLLRDAQAQSSPENLAKAQGLYNEAVTAMEAKDFATACPKLEEVIRLVPEGVGAKLTVAECYEGAGRLASAWSSYIAAEAAAAVAGQTERQQKATARAAALEPRLALLAIKVPADIAAIKGLTISRDGKIVPAPMWGVNVPVDPGTRIVGVSAPGRIPWSSRVTAETGKLSVVNVPMLAITTTTEDDSADSGKNLMLILGGGGVTLIALGVGLGMTVAANGKSSDVDAQGAAIPDGVCASPIAMQYQAPCSALLDTLNDQDSFTDAAIASYVIAGVAGAATLTYALWPTPKSPGVASVRPVPVVTATEGGLWLTGTF
jgi:hypothetical protein